MRVLFVNYEDFRSNSAIHIVNLAEQLAELDVSSSICVPSRPGSVSVLREVRLPVITYSDARRGRFGLPEGAQPDLIHAWTPRERVRLLTEEVCATYGVPYVVHLEDNEDVITADQLGVPLEALLLISEAEFEARIPETISHPHRAREFLANAIGISLIVDRLGEFVPGGVPALVIPPAFEEALFSPSPPSEDLRIRLGIRQEEFVVVYAGNVHPTNAAEVRSLYLAIALVNRRGIPVRLVRLGRDYCTFLDREEAIVEPHVVRVTLRPRSELPSYYALADVFVQPGQPGEFNDYRVPSKLPEFFAMGRPVILPRTNVGLLARDNEECVLLDEGDALDIAQKLERLLSDSELRNRIGRRARQFAEEHFSWRRSATQLKTFYQQVTAARSIRWTADLDQLHTRFSDRDIPALSYATVRDYCDSVESLPYLATRNNDLKDVQRPWAVKAILAAVRPGSRLLEIGAGDPYVADLLARFGYDVTVVDPYDGRDGGPTDFEAIRKAHPNIRFKRGLFPDALTYEDRPFDCIYSISVLEHLSESSLRESWNAIVRFSTAGGHTVHAIDHVLKGVGSEDHLAKLTLIAALAGVEAVTLDRLLKALEDDPEAYFLSAEAHNRWRGDTPYADFPMRRCVSIQLCIPVGRRTSSEERASRDASQPQAVEATSQ